MKVFDQIKIMMKYVINIQWIAKEMEAKEMEFFLNSRSSQRNGLLPMNGIFLKNIPQPNKKARQTRINYLASDFQKSERDFAFVIEKSFKVGLLEKLIKEVDENIIQKVVTFDIFEGESIPKDKKSVAINVTLQALDKTLSEKDIDQVSQQIIEVVQEKTGATIRS